MTRTIWQVSGGPAKRDYADLFIKHGVALIGPGDAGPWSPDRDDADFGDSLVRRFAIEAQRGDVLLLRTGVSSIRAVGLVASEYLYLPQFDDVNGWDLQHARRVHWCRLPEDYAFDAQIFSGGHSRFSKISAPPVLDYAERFIQSPPTYWQTAPLPALPEEEPPLDFVPDFLQELVANVHDLASLYWDGNAFGDHPTEDELVAHYVVPFLRALGWPVERIAIKWRYVDVSVFRALPRTPQNVHFIIEAKRLGAGVEGALEQAKGYLDALGIARDIVVTDGIRYRMYEAGSFRPIAYANLARLKRSALSLFERMKRPKGAAQ